MEKKSLTKGTDKKICGVCSGIAEYFGWDTTLVRVGTGYRMLSRSTYCLFYCGNSNA